MTLRSTAALAIVGLLTLTMVGSTFAQSDESLEAVFPQEVGGNRLDVNVLSGPEWVANFDPAVDVEQAVISRTEALVASVDASLDDLTIATALLDPSPGNVATISAVQVRDTPAHELVDGSVELLLGDVIAPQLEVVFSGARDTLKVRDAEMPGVYPRTLVPAGDTLWIIEAEPPLLAEIVGQLPNAPQRTNGAFDPASSVPLEIDDIRRVFLNVSSGWDLVFWLSETYPQQLESVAVASYLASGVPVDSITTTSSVWLDAEGNIAAVMAAYQFAGADEATMSRLLNEVIAPQFQSVDAATEPETVAGRDVITVRDPSLFDETGAPRPFHIYVSGDTIFAIDALEGTASAVISALP